MYIGIVEGEQMTRKLKYFGFALGLVALFLIVTVKFVEDDRGMLGTCRYLVKLLS